MASRRLRAGGADLTLSPTELVHEAYLRLADSAQVTGRGRAYFFASAAQAMRRIVVEHARQRRRREGGRQAITLSDAIALTDRRAIDVLDLERGLERLETIAERPVQVIECRFYGGLSIDDTALTLGVTARTVNRDWQFARAWLYDFLKTTAAEGPA
jgi:RNA polymerase sigma-70 factor (ECF subfamily)